MSGNNAEAENFWTIVPPLNFWGLSDHESLIIEFTWISMAIVILAFVVVCIHANRIPGPFQNAMEAIIQFLENYTIDIIGKQGIFYFPLILTVFFFLLVANYIGLVPGCIAPTCSVNTTGACALVVFFFYQYVGFKKQGIRYLKHFLGPIPAMAPFMFIMEIISELARPFSLALRLFANIMGGELIIKLLFGICALGLPVIWMTWESLITNPIQAFVFSMLTMIYLAGVIATDDH